MLVLNRSNSRDEPRGDTRSSLRLPPPESPESSAPSSVTSFSSSLVYSPGPCCLSTAAAPRRAAPSRGARGRAPAARVGRQPSAVGRAERDDRRDLPVLRRSAAGVRAALPCRRCRRAARAR